MRATSLMLALCFLSASASAEIFYDPSAAIARIMSESLSVVMESDDISRCYQISDRLDDRRAERGFQYGMEPSHSRVWKSTARRMSVGSIEQLNSSEMPEVVEMCERVFMAAYDCAIAQEKARWETFSVSVEPNK